MNGLSSNAQEDVTSVDTRADVVTFKGREYKISPRLYGLKASDTKDSNNILFSQSFFERDPALHKCRDIFAHMERIMEMSAGYANACSVVFPSERTKLSCDEVGNVERLQAQSAGGLGLVAVPGAAEKKLTETGGKDMELQDALASASMKHSLAHFPCKFKYKSFLVVQELANVLLQGVLFCSFVVRLTFQDPKSYPQRISDNCETIVQDRREGQPGQTNRHAERPSHPLRFGRDDIPGNPCRLHQRQDASPTAGGDGCRGGTGRRV